MTTPVLTTKLYIPPTRSDVILRTRLIERLDEGMQSKLILISAPAGYGKTTLVSNWIRERNCLAAWVSLDEGDNNIASFLTYLITAAQTIVPNIDKGVLTVLQSPKPPPAKAILTALLNDIAGFPHDFLLVIDDYHLIEAAPIDDALAFLVEHLPPQMHLVITTREDPNLPLARLRARRQLTELRAADLRFTPVEASEFFKQVMELNLSTADIDVLETRTEGWIAGLQLAAISMQRHQDVSGFIKTFAGDHHYIVDYLIEEVLAHQNEFMRQFLLQTAILDQMNGSLCDAVTGQQESNERLEALHRGNFFLIPLDNQRRWYRYHHLFAEVLRVHLMSEQPDQVGVLYRRASEWHEQNGSLPEAIRYALSGRDFVRAAHLVEIAVPQLRKSRQEATILGWLQALPEELLRCRPVLSVHYAGSLLQSGKLEGVEALLRDAELWLDSSAAEQEQQGALSAEMVVVDREEFQSLSGAIATYRAALALIAGNLIDTAKQANLVLKVAAENDHLRRAAAAGFIGLINWRNGELEAAHRSYIECMERLQRIGFISDVVGCSITLADLRITQGRLREAMRTYDQGLQLASQGTSLLRGVSDMHVGMSQLFYEYGDLNAATQHLLRSKELGDLAGLPQNPYRWCVAMAQVRKAQGDLDGALDLLHKAEDLYESDFSPSVRPISALKTRLWLAQGRLDEAVNWAYKQGLSTGDDLIYLREFEHITLARILLAQNKSGHADHSMLAASGFLDRLLQAAEQGGRTGSVIEILVLQALTHEMHNNIPAALEPLARALTLAEPEGYVRLFVDEGMPMMILLQSAAGTRIAPNYVRKLLAAFGNHEHKTPAQQALIEPLSERELEVLRLLDTELDGPDIARHLTVSLNTIRTHTKNIYTKLGVNNRRAAVHRAEELHLL